MRLNRASCERSRSHGQGTRVMVTVATTTANHQTNSVGVQGLLQLSPLPAPRPLREAPGVLTLRLEPRAFARLGGSGCELIGPAGGDAGGVFLWALRQAHSPHLSTIDHIVSI